MTAAPTGRALAGGQAIYPLQTPCTTARRRRRAGGMSGCHNQRAVVDDIRRAGVNNAENLHLGDMRAYAEALCLGAVLVVVAACSTPADRPTVPPAISCPVDAAAVARVVGASVIDVNARSNLPIRGCQFAMPPPPGPAGSAVVETLHSRYPAAAPLVAIDQQDQGNLPLTLRDPELSRSCAAGPDTLSCSLFQQEIAIAEAADHRRPGARWSVRVDQFTAYGPLGGWQGDPKRVAEGVLALLPTG